MITIADICDPKRTVDAALIYGHVHRLFQYRGNNHFVTVCREPVVWHDILLFRQRPEDINCPECQEGHYHGH